MRARFLEELGLAGFGGGPRGLRRALSDAHYAEDAELAESGSRDEQAQGVAMEIGRRELDAGIEHLEEVVGDDAFQFIGVAKTQADPEAVELGAAEEGFALGFEGVLKFLDEVDALDLVELDFAVFAVGGEKIEFLGGGEDGRVEITLERLLAHKLDHDLLVRRGWGSEFHEFGGSQLLSPDGLCYPSRLFCQLIGA